MVVSFLYDASGHPICILPCLSGMLVMTFLPSPFSLVCFGQYNVEVLKLLIRDEIVYAS
jgi:hypothetical protein